MAAMPIRPAWRDSDSRWRRRVLAGVWVLVLVPLMAALERQHWTESVPLPSYFNVAPERSLDDSMLPMTYVWLTSCIGMVLLFSKERNRRRSRLDRTRGWGVLATYVVLFLGFTDVALITSLVILGIAAVFHSMPPAYQPPVTETLAGVGAAYARYGPIPCRLFYPVHTALSAAMMLLASVPLFHAMRSCASKVLAAIFLAPLAVAALLQLGYAGFSAARSRSPLDPWEYAYLHYFCPRLLIGNFGAYGWSSPGREAMMEFLKWSACLAIAVWLSLAQVVAMWRNARKSSTGRTAL